MMDNGWIPPADVVSPGWLERDLTSDLADTIARDERSLFDRRIGDSNADLILFGAGNLGRRTLAGLRRVGVEPLGFVDNDRSRDGTTLDGLPVKSPEKAAAAFGNQVAVVVTIWIPMGHLAYPEVADQMRALGFTRIQAFVPLFWKYSEEFLPNFCLDAPHLLYEHADDVKAAYGLLADDASKSEYLIQLSYLLSAMQSIGNGISHEIWWNSRPTRSSWIVVPTTETQLTHSLKRVPAPSVPSLHSSRTRTPPRG
jgi:hypothetical protein